MVGRRILVTGSSGALGSTVCRHLESHGGTVLRFGGRTLGEVDLADGEAVARALASHWRDGPIDAAVLAAGGYASHTIGEADGQVEAMLAANLRTAVNVVEALLPRMVERGLGRIVAVGAYAIRHPGAAQGAYAASKAALAAYMASAAESARRADVSVVTVMPTTLDTPANRRQMPDADWSRWVSLERAAAAIGFLVSEDAGDLNGAEIAVRGRL